MKNTFTPVAWTHHTNIYEVNIRQYSDAGTLNAFAEHLPRLKDMGVETLWLMPLQPIGKLHRKGILGSYYSISDYISLNPEYGLLDDFKLLVEEAHRYNMKVIIDWVANHTSWDHVWTQTHPDFFSKNEYGDFRPPYPDWADVIHLNYENKELWLEMVNAMKFWVKNFDIDGFRCDMAHLVPLDFWEYARTELDNEKKLFWLAETEEPNYHEVFDASYTWKFLHTMESYWERETNIDGLDAVLRRYESAFPKSAIRMFFTSNHDENSHSGSEYERMGHAAKAFAVLCATWNGVPLIYSGQELPNSQRLKFFEKDPIQWTGNFGLHNFYKTLLELHRDHPALHAADENVRTYRIPTSEDEKIFSFLRKIEEREVLVILNLSAIDDLHFEISG
ncbi:MAG TPA: alpha-amylase family glycosyl hydrolase, partial [Chitinophagaceae bacterium]|nr:alpha-amylase family glycosyl hydrolase [Chitinophagaceae bacterium]